MADHTKTVSNSINCFGMGPSTKWSTAANYTMTWGSSKWGEGTEDIIHVVDHAVENSTAITTAVGKDVTHLVSDAQVITPTSTANFDFSHSMDAGSMTITGEITDLRLQNGDWYYEFIDRTTDADDQRTDGFSSVSDTSTTWTTVSDASTSWTEV